jgi:hypothetical protein
MTHNREVERIAEGLSASEAATEIGRLVSRIAKLAPVAGLYIGIRIEPALRTQGARNG